MRKKKLKNWFCSIQVFGFLFFSVFIFGGSQCGRQESELEKAENQAEREKQAQKQAFSDLLTCSVAYQEQFNLSEAIFTDVKDIGCFADEDQETAKALLLDLKTQLSDFNRHYLQQSPLDDVDAALSAKAEFRTIAISYQGLQEYLAYCRTNYIMAGSSKGDVLEHGPSLQQDRIYLHVLGDVFGTDSGFEGNSQESDTLIHRTNVLKVIQEQLLGRIFIKDEKQVRPCKDSVAVIPKGRMPYPDLPQDLLNKLIAQSENAERLMRVFSGDRSKVSDQIRNLGETGALQAVLQEQLRALKPGESVFLPAGWSSHAVFYQITKEKSVDTKITTYTFRIFNSGEGISTYHASTIAGYKAQYFPFVEVKEISFENVTGLVFLKSLKEVAAPLAYKSKPQDFYEKLLLQLDGKNQKIAYGADDFEDPQLGGTCTYFAAPWVLSSSVAQFLDDDKAQAEFIPDQIEFLINLKTLRDYAGNRENEKDGMAGIGDVRLNLLKKGLNYFSEQTLRARDGFAIDGGSLAAAAMKADAISQKILQAESVIQAKLAKNVPQFNATNVAGIPLAKLSNSIKSDSLIAANARSVLGRTLDLSIDWQVPSDKDQLLKDLKAFYDRIQDAIEQNYFTLAIDAIQQIALSLPLEKKWWNNTSEDQAIQLIHELSRLDKLYLFALLEAVRANQRLEKQVSTIELLASIKFLTVSDLLNQKLPYGLPSMSQKLIRQYLYGDTAIFETEDPKWQWQIKLLRVYYEGQKGEDFFGFSKYPAGASTERRIHFDPSAVQELGKLEMHWSRNTQWADVGWVVNAIKQQPGYQIWLEKEIGDNNKNRFELNSIKPWTFHCSAPVGLTAATCSPELFSVKRVDRPSIGEDILVRRLAVDLLTKNAQKGILFQESLPQVFYDLRAASVVTDYMLTSSLVSIFRPQFSDDIGLDKIEDSVLLDENDARRLCNCDGIEEYQDIKVDDVTVKFEREEWNLGRQAYDYFPDTRVERRETKITKTRHATKPGRVSRTTSFGYADVEYRIFGKDDDKPIINTYYKGSERIKSDFEFEFASPYVHLKNTAIPFKKYETDRENSKWQHDEVLRLFNIGLTKDGELADPKNAPTRRRYQPNWLILKTTIQEDVTGISLERMRGLLGLSQIKEQQLIQTLAYFTKFGERLSQPEYQRMFEKLMMEPSLILDQLTVNERQSSLFIDKLSRFCKEKFESFKSYGDYKGMAFILHMNQLFVNELAFALTIPEGKVAKNSVSQFLDTAEELFNLIQKLNKQPDEKSFLYENLAASFFYKNRLERHDVELLLLAVIESKTFAHDKKFNDAFRAQETKHILTKHAGRIRQALVNSDNVSDKGKEILDFIVKHARPDLQGNGNWKIANNGPAVIFESSFQQPDAQIQINIADGRIFDAGKSQVLFPVKQKDYEAIFGDSEPPQYATEIAYEQFQWSKSGLRIRAQRHDAVTWTLQQEVSANVWYQYMRPSELQDIKDSKAIFAGYDYWKSLDKVDGKWQFRVLDTKTKKEKYQIRFDDPELETPNPSVVRLADKAELIDVDAQSSYRIFERIEDWRYVYIWAIPDVDGKLVVKEVALPRLGLLFLEKDLTGKESSLTCGPWKDYTVSKEQFSIGLRMPLNYLMCSGNKPDQKQLVVMPVAKLVNVLKATGLLAQFQLEFSTDPKDDSVAYFTYEIDLLRADGLVIAPSNAARYYLALRYLWQQHYRLAAQQIQSILSSSRAFNKREIEILKWMAAGNPVDHDPRAYAVRLRAEFELARDLERYHGQFVPEANVEVTELSELYFNYLQKVERIDHGLLGLHEEERIARRLLNATVTAIHELNKPQVLTWTQEERIREKIKEHQKIQKKIESRMLAINAELKNELFEVQINAVHPGEMALMQSRSLLVIDETYVLQKLEQMFSAEKSTGSPSTDAHALDAAAMVTVDNFGLLYRIMAGEDFNHHEAVFLLKSVLGDDAKFNSLTKEELKREFVMLIRMAVLVDKIEQYSDPFKEQRMNARLLAAVAEAKSQNSEMKTYAEIRRNFVQIKENDERRKSIAVEIIPVRTVWNKAYMEKNNLSAPQQYQNGKLNPTYEAEMKYYKGEEVRLEELVRVRRDAMRRLDLEEYNLVNASKNIRNSLLQYFNGVQNSDNKEHKIAETPVQPGKVKFSGHKKTLQKAATADILNAQIPLAEIAKADPLATPILTEAFFTSLNVINEQALDLKQQRKVDNAAASLNQVLQKIEGDTMPTDVKAAVNVLQGKVLERALDIKAKKKFYKIKNFTELKNISLRIKGKNNVYEHIVKLEDAETRMKAHRHKILELGRKYASKLEGGAYTKLYHLADLGKQNDINDLIYLLLKRNLVVFYEQSSGAHDLKEINELYENLINYLMLTTYMKHAERVADSVDAVISKHEAGLSESSDEFQQLLENMVSAGREMRRYDIANHIEYLIFEHFMNIMLRKNQVEALDELQIKDGKIENERALGGVLEMIMGAGKTSVLLPLLSALDTSGEWLNMIILPEALVASMSEQLSSQLGTAFARGVDVLVVSRQRYLREPDLKLLYDGLVRARLQSRTIITTNGAIQSLFLSFVDRLSRYEKDKNQVSGEIEAFIKIFRFLREYGRLTIDEVDLALDILQAHQFSVGDPISLMRDKDKVLQTLPATILSLYHLIATTPALYEEVDLPFLSYSRGHGALTATSYQKFKKLLVQNILTANPFFFGFKDLNAIFRDFVAIKANSDLVKNYLLKGTVQNREALLSKIDGSARDINQANRLKDIMTTLYDELNVVFELSATKKLGVHYGPLPYPGQRDEESEENYKRAKKAYLTSRYVAIPYHSGEPMVNSRFGTPVEALNYTIQMALERRNYGDMVEDEIESLKRMVEGGSEAKIRKGRFKERFERLVGEKYPYPIGAIGPKQIIDIAKDIGKKDRSAVQFDLVSRYVAPQVTVYPMQLQTNAQVYEALFKHVQGFTGTLWSADTFPKIFRKPRLSDTAEKTFLILWQDYLEQKEKNTSDVSFKSLQRGSYRGPQLLASLVQQIYTGWKKPGSFMDEAGVFRVFDNIAVAEEMLKVASNTDANIQGVIFYDAQDNLKIISASGTEDMSASKIPLNNRIAFWDKKHTTGSDLRLKSDMQAKVAVDHHTTSRGLQQTVWRLRGLGTGQQIVQYVALEDDLDIIKKRLKEEWKIKNIGELDLGDLILYVVVNQETRLGDLRFRAVKQKMKNVIVSRVLGDMFGKGPADTSVDVYSAAMLYGTVRKLFEVSLEKDKLYLSMGLPRHELDVSEALDAEQKRVMSADYAKALKQGWFSTGEAYEQVDKAIEKLKREEEPLLPRQIMASNFDNDLEIEIELEMEQEQEEEQEQEQEMEQYQMDANHKVHAILLWSLEDSNLVYQKQFFTPASADNLGTNPNYWLLRQKQVQPMISLPAALAYKKQNFLANAFDKDILLSFNLAPIHHRNVFTTDSHYEYEFFSVYHKYPGDVLIIEDKATQEIRLVLLDGDDVVQWSQFLTLDALSGNTSRHRDLRLGLYNINLANKGVYQDGAEEINEEMLKKNVNFLKLIVEVKFFAGSVHYTKEEEPYLQGFLFGPDADLEAQRKYAKKMLDIFRGQILKLRHDSTQMFRGSDIEATFETLLGELD